jgi:hypothetical protein
VAARVELLFHNDMVVLLCSACLLLKKRGTKWMQTQEREEACDLQKNGAMLDTPSFTANPNEWKGFASSFTATSK